MEPGREYKEVARNNIDEDRAASPGTERSTGWVNITSRPKATPIFDGNPHLHPSSEQYLYCIADRECSREGGSEKVDSCRVMAWADRAVS